MKKGLPVTIIAMAVLFVAESLFSASLTEERRYEPVVIQAFKTPVRSLAGARVDQMYLYAWDSGAQQWRLMPFQIDEQTFGPNPLNPNVNKWFYFIPPVWSEVDSINISEHNGIFDDHDELVFMVADCGDKAPLHTWLETDGEKLHPKVELILRDPQNPENAAYAYIFTSAVKKEIPTPYEFHYNVDEDKISTKYYQLGLSESGGVDEIAIQPPGGNGKDLLDQLKIRFSGILDFAFPIAVLVKERDFYLYPDITVTKQPIVRLIRESRITLALGDYLVEELSFPVVTKFYPYSGFIKGGTSLAPEDLSFYYNDVEVMMIVDSIRESWDYNENAVGMKYYNKYNNGVLIDGIPDEVDKTVDIPVNSWDLTTGEQGSLFKIAEFQEQKWGGVELYYFDNKNGGQADSAEFDYGDEPDTGDSLSYGDNGILFKNKPDQDSVTIELNYTIYFLPEKNLTRAFGENFAEIINNPVDISQSIISSIEAAKSAPTAFLLLNNYPNPFNSSTMIRFTVPMQAFVRLDIYDLQGRLVSNLAAREFVSGNHVQSWNGKNDHGELMPSGVYYCRMQAGDYNHAIKLLMIK